MSTMTIIQAENALSSTILETWSRVRSSAEIDSLLTRRELALAEVEDEE